MLRLDKLELRGFKSFSDATEVWFRSGITAVVGPNGCGKSNIGDALNWVLGEQSAKTLRGQQMADVIFGGSEGRKPLGMAEVSLTLNGAEGLSGADQGKVVLTRRLFRSGESEYLLNGSRTRLKDIQEMLREAKVGVRTYATIEQGKIDQVLNAKPRDRRALIEDAAGISGYKHKRRLAELKLEATYANLLRVNDIIVEVQRQINSLKRQAAKARRYRRLREELRGKELTRFTHRAREMDRELERLREAEAGARDRETEAAAGLARLEARLEEQRGLLEQAGRAFRERSERLHQQDIEIDRQESQVRSCRERIAESAERAARQRAEAATLEERLGRTAEQSRAAEAEIEDGAGRLERLSAELTRRQSELDEAGRRLRELREELEGLRKRQFDSMHRGVDLRNRLRVTEDAVERIRGQMQRLEAEQAEAQQDAQRNRSEADQLADESGRLRRRLELETQVHADLESALSLARERQTADLEALAQTREREKSALARLSTLEALETRFAGVSDGVKTLLASGEVTGIRTRGVVADYVEAPRDMEGAAEGYLQWLLPTVILEDDHDAQRAAEFLRAEGAGRTSLICWSQPAGALAVGTPGNGRSELPPEILQDGRVLGRLRDRLTLKTSSNGVLADRIGDAVLVDCLKSALELHRRHPVADYLTPEGEVVYASGVISAGGLRASEQGLLAHKRHTQDARQEGAEASALAARLLESVEAGRDEIVRLEVGLREAKQAQQDTERRSFALEHRAQRSAEETERTTRRTEVLADELAGLRSEAASLKSTLGQLLDERQRVEEAHQDLERTLRQKNDLFPAREHELQTLGETVTGLRTDQAALQQRQEGAEREGRRLAGEAAELQARVAALQSDATAAEAAAKTSDELLTRTECELVQSLERRKQLTEEVGRMERDIGELREALVGQEDELRKRRGDLENLREATREAELDRTRSESTREHLDDLCRQELGLSATEAAASDPCGSGSDADRPEQEIDLQALEAEVEEIKQRIERIGPVNMTAIEEFTELEERHEFLTSQRKDLEESMESLKETIRRINRQSRQRFLEAFEAVRQSYQEVYTLLFRGGRADLRLEEGEDVLECGIEILAQPPGKRLTGVHLLSGGEKALSAIALLFAIFRYQPSPFCLLDEVDAALDDANVGRFTRMLLEYAKNTQFVIVTHNKVSMEAADVLYGVTMEEPGVSKVVSMQFA